MKPLPPSASPPQMKVRYSHRRLPQATREFHVRGLRFEARGGQVLLIGHCATGGDLEIEMSGQLLLDLMQQAVKNKEGQG